ncbi:MAG: hypothetical protein HC892_12840 [Saprospiraceae bacterium]|nr:hypothetical protein [Saprospiraceae bacterium]
MEKSQLVKLLRTFSKKEVRECRKWLQSPFHNQREDVLCLFDYYFHEDNLQREEVLEKQKVYPYIFEGEPYDDAKFRQTMYFLLRSVEEFLTYNALQQEEVLLNTHLASVYREKSLVKYANKILSNTKQKIEEAPFRDVEYCQLKYAIAKEEYAIAEGQQRFDAQHKLIELINTYRVAYLAEELSLTCLLYASPNPSINEYEDKYLKDIVLFINQLNLHENQSINLYQLIYRTLAFKEDNQFQELKGKLKEYKQYFKPDELRELYLLVINYCIRRANMTGKRDFFVDAFQIYKLGIETSILIDQNGLDRFLFRNIISVGGNIKEFEWVEQFIQKYQVYLEPQYKDSFVNFGFGLLYYQTKQYDKAMQYLAQYEHDDVLLNLNSKSMLMKIYYEREEADSLESLLDSFKVYLRRKKEVGDNHRILYNNLIKFTRKLLRANPYDAKKKEKLREEIMEANPLVNKEWFLEQLEKM